MSFRGVPIILICFSTGVLALFSSSDEPENINWKCIHDILKPPKVIYAVETSSNRVDRGVLEEYDSIRIYTEYDTSILNNVEHGSRLMNKIIPSAVQYFQGALKVKRRTVPILLSRPCLEGLPIQLDPYPMCNSSGCEFPVQCGDTTVPDDHLAACQVCDDTECVTQGSDGVGVSDADFILYVSAVDSSNCGTNTLAYASFCGLESTLDRPVAGYMNFCPLSLEREADDERIIFIAKHELAHSLAFSFVLFPFWRDSDGNPRTPRESNGLPPQVNGLFTISSSTVQGEVKYWNTITGLERRGRVQTYSVVTEAVVNQTQAHFGCSTAGGLELNFLTEFRYGRPGSHWDKKLVENELMSPTITENGVVSSLTLALFEDTGWYKVDYRYAEPLLYGRNLGCEFIEESCYTWMINRGREGQSIRPYCNVSLDDVERSRDCSFDRQSVARCGIVQYSTALIDSYRYFSDPTIGGYTSMSVCPVLFDRSIVERSNVNGVGRCRIAGNQPELLSNVLAESYGTGSRCVNHGNSRSWNVNGQDVMDTGAGCYQYNCTSQGVEISILEVAFLCTCEGKEIIFDMHFTDLNQTIQGSILCPSCSDICWDEQHKCPSEVSSGSCFGTVENHSINCTSNVLTQCFVQEEMMSPSTTSTEMVSPSATSTEMVSPSATSTEMVSPSATICHQQLHFLLQLLQSSGKGKECRAHQRCKKC